MKKMVTPLKIDSVELHKLLEQKKTTKEIAAHFNCTPGAVSQAKRRLGIAVVREMASSIRAAPVIVKNADDAKRELSKLISVCNDKINWIEECVNQSSGEHYQNWQRVMLRHVAEIRKLIGAMADIEYKLHHVEIVEKALMIMFEEIGHESKECQKRIRDRLERSQILFQVDD
jgi:uncharacterized protein YukE